MHRGRMIQALRGVSFGIEPGEVLALLGPNRAGKTTLLKILLGLCHPSGGRVFRLGRPISQRSTLARVGYMHENQAFPRYLTAAALLEFYGQLSLVPASVLRTRVPALLEKMGLTDRAHEPIARFSKGMVQRLALAQALIAEPDLLVLDEPMEGLDLARGDCSRRSSKSSGTREKPCSSFRTPWARWRRFATGWPFSSRDGSPISVPWPPCCAIRTRAACGLSKRPWGQFIDPDGSAP